MFFPMVFLSVSILCFCFRFCFRRSGEFFHGGVEAGPAFVCGFGIFQGDGACCGTGGGEGGKGDAVIAEGVDGAGGDCAGGDFQCVFCGCCVYTQGAEHGGGGGDAVGLFCAKAADACEGGACLGGEDGEGHEEVGGVGEVDGCFFFDGFDVVVDFYVALEAAGGEVFEADAASHFVGDDEVGGVAEVAFYVGVIFVFGLYERCRYPVFLLFLRRHPRSCGRSW